MIANPVYVGPWSILTKVEHALCPDGVRRLAQCTAFADGYYAYHMAIRFHGKTMGGFVDSFETPDGQRDYRFTPYVKRANGMAIYERLREVAYSWHGGQWSELYAFASSGIAHRGRLLCEITECLMLAQQRLHGYAARDEMCLESLRHYVVHHCRYVELPGDIGTASVMDEIGACFADWTSEETQRAYVRQEWQRPLGVGAARSWMRRLTCM